MKRNLWDVILPVWMFVFFWIWVGVLFCTGSANAETLPTSQHYLAIGRAEDCAVTRDLIGRARHDMEESRAALAGHLADLKSRRMQLEECARKSGITRLSDLRDAALAAELCPAAYQAWLKPGLGRLAAQEDYQSASESLRKLTWHLDAYCRRIPGTKLAARKNF